MIEKAPYIGVTAHPHGSMHLCSRLSDICHACGAQK